VHLRLLIMGGGVRNCKNYHKTILFSPAEMFEDKFELKSKK
jgi:hypothetical protein